MKNEYGFVSGAVTLLPLIRKLRDHVEYEKFLSRVIVDNETTQKFRIKTEKYKNKLYKFRYNNKDAIKLTAAGKTDGTESE